ncbi:hypothetical protein ACOSQ2_002838 [Xanthoceras sorbifolium]
MDTRLSGPHRNCQLATSRKPYFSVGSVWWAVEASKGANWYLQPQVVSISQGIALQSSLKLSTLANAITLKKLIRKGIPPVLRPKAVEARSRLLPSRLIMTYHVPSLIIHDWIPPRVMPLCDVFLLHILSVFLMLAKASTLLMIMKKEKKKKRNDEHGHDGGNVAYKIIKGSAFVCKHE